MRHPFYLLFAGATCVMLFMANHRGWSFLGRAFAPLGGGGGRSGLYHK